MRLSTCKAIPHLYWGINKPEHQSVIMIMGWTSIRQGSHSISCFGWNANINSLSHSETPLDVSFIFTFLFLFFCIHIFKINSDWKQNRWTRNTITPWSNWQAERKWMKKKRQVLCCLIQPFLQSLKSCLGQYNQWTSKHWGFNSASVIQTGVCDHHLKLLLCGSVCRGTWSIHRVWDNTDKPSSGDWNHMG